MTFTKLISFVLLVILLWNVFVTSTPYKQRSSSVFNNLNEATLDDNDDVIPKFPKEFINIVSKGSSVQAATAITLSSDNPNLITSESSGRQLPPTSTFSSTMANTVTVQDLKKDEENDEENSSTTPVIESPIAINIVNEEKMDKQQPIIIKLMPGSNSKNAKGQELIIPIYSIIDNDEDIVKNNRKGNLVSKHIGQEEKEEENNQLPLPPVFIKIVDGKKEILVNYTIISTTLIPPESRTTSTMATTGTTIESLSSDLSTTITTSVPLYYDTIFPVPEFIEDNTTRITTAKDQTTENKLTPELAFPWPTFDNKNNGSEIGKRSQDNNEFDDDDDDTIEPKTLELKPLKGPPCPGFTRQCNSYFDCDFQNGADDNDTRTWFKCDGKHCICDLLGYIRDDDAEWTVTWSKKNQKCVSDLNGPCGVNDGLEIHCSKEYQCINNVCGNSGGRKVYKDRKNKAHGESQNNETDTITNNADSDTEMDMNCTDSIKDHGNIFSLLFFPNLNIFDSILNDSLNNIREMF